MAKDVMGRFCEYVYANVETLTDDIQNLKSQNVTSSWGGNRKLPYAFT